MPGVEKFAAADAEVIATETVYQGFFKMLKIRIRHRLFAGGYSEEINRELFTRGSASAVLLYDPVNRLIGLVEQFRVGALKEPDGPWLFEVIAGMIDEHSDAEATALKEVGEESGITGVQLHPIGDYLVSPGGTDEKMFLFCGLTCLLNKAGLFGLDKENEDIRFHVLAEEDVFAAFEQGCFNNAATTIALLWLQLHKSTLGSRYAKD